MLVVGIVVGWSRRSRKRGRWKGEVQVAREPGLSLVDEERALAARRDLNHKFQVTCACTTHGDIRALLAKTRK